MLDTELCHVLLEDQEGNYVIFDLLYLLHFFIISYLFIPLLIKDTKMVDNSLKKLGSIRTVLFFLMRWIRQSPRCLTFLFNSSVTVF
jgi:hypothetical protein